MADEIKRLNVPISPELHTEIKIQAAKDGKTIAQWVLEAIQNKLENEEN